MNSNSKNNNSNIENRNNALSDKDKKKLIQLWIFNITVIVFAFAIYFYPQNMEQELIGKTEAQLAERKAQQLARWMIKNKFEFIEYKSEESLKMSEQEIRGLASTQQKDNQLETHKVQKFKGQIGRDPWGRPFLFEVTNQGQKGALLFVQSLGENGKNETLELAQKSISKNGDDIQIQVSVD